MGRSGDQNANQPVKPTELQELDVEALAQSPNFSRGRTRRQRRRFSAATPYRIYFVERRNRSFGIWSQFVWRRKPTSAAALSKDENVDLT
jgi:hypothetical protein